MGIHWGNSIAALLDEAGPEVRAHIAASKRRKRTELRAAIDRGDVVRVWQSGVVAWELNMTCNGRRVVSIDRANGTLTLAPET